MAYFYRHVEDPWNVWQSCKCWGTARLNVVGQSWHGQVSSTQLVLIIPAALEGSNSFVMESQHAGLPFQLITSENNASAFC